VPLGHPNQPPAPLLCPRRGGTTATRAALIRPGDADLQPSFSSSSVTCSATSPGGRPLQPADHPAGIAKCAKDVPALRVGQRDRRVDWRLGCFRRGDRSNERASRAPLAAQHLGCCSSHGQQGQVLDFSSVHPATPFARSANPSRTWTCSLLPLRLLEVTSWHELFTPLPVLTCNPNAATHRPTWPATSIRWRFWPSWPTPTWP
jgi:hypothetical protein